MGEIMRFRIARAPQRMVRNPDTEFFLTEGPTMQAWARGEGLIDRARNYIQDLALLPPRSRFAHPNEQIAAMLKEIRWLDQMFVQAKNRIALDAIRTAVTRHFDVDSARLVERDEWGLLRETLSLTLLAAAVTNVTPALRSDVLRLLLVMGVLELISVGRNRCR